MKTLKNVHKKRKNENFEQKMGFFLMSQGSFNPKIRFLGTHGNKDRQTRAKVTTVVTLSEFQKFFLQPIIKDRLKKHEKT